MDLICMFMSRLRWKTRRVVRKRTRVQALKIIVSDLYLQWGKMKYKQKQNMAATKPALGETKKNQKPKARNPGHET